MKPTLLQTFKYKSSTFREGILFSAEYDLAVEELLEIYIDDAPYSVTMRLPGDDIHLAIGFCFTEGIIESLEDLSAITPCEGHLADKRIFVHLNGAVCAKETVLGHTMIWNSTVPFGMRWPSPRTRCRFRTFLLR